MRETNRSGCCESQNNMRSAWKFFIVGSVLLAIGVIAPDIALAQCTDGFCPLADVKVQNWQLCILIRVVTFLFSSGVCSDSHCLSARYWQYSASRGADTFI